MTTEPSPDTATKPGPSSDGNTDGPFTVGQPVTTHPVDKRERSRSGVVHKPGTLLSKVRIGGEVLTFWNFELHPMPELNA